MKKTTSKKKTEIDINQVIDLVIDRDQLPSFPNNGITKERSEEGQNVRTERKSLELS